MRGENVDHQRKANHKSDQMLALHFPLYDATVKLFFLSADMYRPDISLSRTIVIINNGRRNPPAGFSEIFVTIGLL